MKKETLSFKGFGDWQNQYKRQDQFKMLCRNIFGINFEDIQVSDARYENILKTSADTIIGQLI